MVADQKDIAQFLNPAKKLSVEDKNWLSQLKDLYPWSEPVQMAFLKSLRDTQDLRFSSELNRVALISTDRARLYKFIYGHDLQQTIDKIEAEIEQIPVPLALEENPSEHISEPESLEASEFDVPVKLSEPKQEEVTEPKEVRTPKVAADSQEITDENLTDSTSDTPTHTEQESVNNLQTAEPIAEDEETIEENSELDHLIISEAVSTTIRQEVIEDIEEFKSVTPEVIPEPAAEPSESNVSSDEFIDWLVKHASSINYPSFDASNSQSDSTDAASLIDKFIKNEPQISRGKAQEFTTENIAAASLVDNEEFVTETLAEIYANQGNISKAKRAFQLLSLKYPEKSIYFAARIKQLGRKK